MPFGVGTKFYGCRGLQRTYGQCEFCGRTVELRNYETTRWFRIFVPLLPLGRKQIVAECSACGRRKIVSVGSWEAERNKLVEADQAALAAAALSAAAKSAGSTSADPKSAAPNSGEIAGRLLENLLAVGRFQEGSDLANRIQRDFSGDIAAQMHLAGYFDTLGRKTEAAAAWRRAHDLDPQNLAAKHGFAVSRIEMGGCAEVRPLLAADPPIPAAKDPGLYVALAKALQRANSHRQALDVLAEVNAESPESSRRRSFRETVYDSRQVERGYQKSLPAVRRIPAPGRRFWAATAAAFVALLFAAWYITGRHTVYLINGFTQPVEVSIDGGEKLVLAPREHQTVTLADGRHKATFVLGAGAPRDEEFTVKSEFVERFKKPRFFFYSPGSSAVVEHEQLDYNGPTDPPTRTYGLFLGDSGFETTPPADNLFVPFASDRPEVAAGATVSRSRIGVPEIRSAVVLQIFSGGPVDEMMTFAELHLQDDPKADDLVAAYTAYATGHEQTKRCLEFLATGLKERPVRTEWHRSYQNVRRIQLHEDKQVRAEYTELLNAEPQNSALLYLRGRIEPDGKAAIDYFKRSIDADPKNPYPRFAEGVELMVAGDLDAALPLVREANRLHPNQPEIHTALQTAELAAGDHKPLEKDIRKAAEGAPFSLDLHLQLMQTLVAEGGTKEAGEAEDQFEKRLKAAAGDQANDAIRVSQLAYLYMQRKFSDMATLVKAGGPTPADQQAQFFAEVELGHLDAAAAILDASPQLDAGGDLSLALSIAWRARGNDKLAAQWQAKACKIYNDSPDELHHLAADILRQAPSIDAAKARHLLLPAPVKAIWLTALAQQCPDQRAELLTLAKQLNFNQLFPNHFLNQTILQMAKNLGKVPDTFHESQTPPKNGK